MKRFYLVSSLSLVLFGFANAQSSPAPAAGAAQTNADNTAQNSGGQGKDAATADKQPNDKADVDALQKIRQAVVQDKSLSFNAKNTKIIVANGMATLRGPVENEQEKATMAQKAAEVVGKDKVHNELMVKDQGK
jgi:hyperosmotically inducible protein